jgi:nitrate/nitrite transporter NarK
MQAGNSIKSTRRQVLRGIAVMVRLALALMVSEGAVYAAVPTQIATESGLVEGMASAAAAAGSSEK